ncbi:hypothetical protein PYCC9005_001130 [Savitreella phatthalungensis]
MSSENKPGLVASHAAYAKGAAEETIGNLTGSAAWQTSGKEIQEEAKSQMREAAERSDRVDTDVSNTRQPTDSLAREGALEQKIGSLVGCEGMEQQGAEKSKVAEQK